MPLHGKNPIRLYAANRSLIHGSFVTVNGAVPTNLSPATGRGWTVAYVSEGLWTVTLDEACQEIESIFVSAAPETLTNETVIAYVDQDSITTTAFNITLMTSADASATNLAADDDPGAVISFLAVLRETSYA